MHIEKRRRRWYAVLDIPKALQGTLGKRRFIQSLETDSQAVALRRAAPLVAGWKQRIERAKGNSTEDSLEQEARFWREAIQQAAGEEAKEALVARINDRADSIVAASAPAREVGGPDETQWEDLPGQKDAGRFFQLATGQTVRTNEHAEEYLAALQGHNEQKTIDLKRGDLVRLAKRFPLLRDVNAREVRRWLLSHISEEKLARATVNRLLSTCRGYWRYLQDKDAASEDLQPFAVDISRALITNGGRAAAGPTKRPYTAREVSALLHAAKAKGDGKLADLIQLGMYTGARIEELCALKVTDVALKAKAFTIQKAKTNAGQREVPIHTKLIPLMKRLIREANEVEDDYILHGLTPNKYGDRSNAIGKRFGRLKKDQGHGPEKDFHSLRRTVVTLLENAGAPEGIVADIVGHVKQTITFGLYSGGNALTVKASAIKKLNYP